MYFNELIKNYDNTKKFLNNKAIVIDTLFNDKKNYNNIFKEYYSIVEENFKNKNKNIKLSLRGMEFSIKLNSFIVHMILWKPYLYFKQTFNPKFIIKTSHMDSDVISKYGDMIIDEFLNEENQMELNNCLSEIIEELGYISLDFNFAICNTINLYDKIQLAKRNKLYNDLIHTKFDEENQTTDEIEQLMNQKANQLFDILATEDNCFHDYINSGEGANKGQLTQFEISVGPKPSLSGAVFPKIVNTNFLVDGLQTPSDYFIDASGGQR